MKQKHKWKHLIKHNKNEGPFPTYFCQKCGNFASGASTLQFPYVDSFSKECKKL